MNNVIATKSVKLLGGPLHGSRVNVPRSADMHKVGTKKITMWTYMYAGKVDGVEVFCIVPKERSHRRFIQRIIQQHGKHPRVLSPERTPFRHSLTREQILAVRRQQRHERLAALKRA